MDDLIFKEAVFYVMSGTGNTYRVSRWIEEIVIRNKIRAKVVMIEDADHGFTSGTTLSYPWLNATVVTVIYLKNN